MLPIWLLRWWDCLAQLRLDPDADLGDLSRRAASVRYHLGRGRRAREDGRYEAGAAEARRAITANPGNPWAYSLLGQCLVRRQPPDLIEARRALEHACALCPSNGYFVRLLLEVLDAQGDGAGRDDALARAWWSGAPVERWLPNGPPVPAPAQARSSELSGFHPHPGHVPRALVVAGPRRGRHDARPRVDGPTRAGMDFTPADNR